MRIIKVYVSLGLDLSILVHTCVIVHPFPNETTSSDFLSQVCVCVCECAGNFMNTNMMFFFHFSFASFKFTQKMRVRLIVKFLTHS